MPQTPNSLSGHWLPFTANRDFKSDPRLLVRAEGMWYWSHTGEKILDAASGLFCCAAGHGRKEIADAVAAQLTALDYGPSFQFGHPIAFEFASRLARITPGDLNQIFFVNSGSEAIDTALKIAMAWHLARGEGQRLRFVSRERAYHGVNIGGTALSGILRNRETFGAVLPNVVHMRHTVQPEHRFIRGQAEHGAGLADDLQRFVDLYGAKTIAACFVEPIAGSTGVLVPPKGYLQRLREICDAHGILLVFDEVICGFGRTGRAFGADSFGVVPDMMTMAKALTNGAQPMGAVAVRDDIYETITSRGPAGGIELFHGYTYSAHPAACAAGLAALDIYEREHLFERAAAMSGHFLDGIFSLADIPIVTDIRGYGMLAAFDLAPAATPGARGMDVLKRLYAAGLLIKLTGDTVIVAPPLIATAGDLDQIAEILRAQLLRL
jgi:beta-alanine--pyruvate transaminase